MANLGVVWRRGIGVGELEVSGNIYHNSGFFWESNNRLQQGAHDLANSQTGLTLLNRNCSVKLWVSNLFDKCYYSFPQASWSGDRARPPRRAPMV